MPRTHKTWSPKRQVTFHTLSGRKVLTTVPEEWTAPAYLEDSVKLETGVYVQNAKRGKKYGYARLYDLHVRKGSQECEGYQYVAYLISNPWDAEEFRRVEALLVK